MLASPHMTRVSALLAAVFLALSLPAKAQPNEDVRVQLVSFSPWAAPDRPLSLAIEIINGGATPLEDVTIRLAIRDRVRSRSALRASLDGNPSGDEIAVTREDHDGPVAAGARATISIQRDLGSLASAFRAGRALSGVYPIEIGVSAAGTAIVERAGAFVFLASAPEKRLNVTWVMPIHRPLAADAGGAFNRATIGREILENSKLRIMADLLAAHPSMPLTLAPSGVVADELLDLADGFRPRGERAAVPSTDPLARAAADLLARYKAALASPVFELATTTFGRAAITRLVASGLSSDAGRQVRVGRESVLAAFGRAAIADVFVDGILRADVGSARSLAALGAKTLIIDSRSLRSRPEGRFGPDLVEEVRASRLAFDALLVDTPIRDRMEIASEDRVLTAMGVLAETAATFFERPAGADGRLLVIGTASMPEPGIAAPLMDALAQVPWVQMRTASNVAADPILHSPGEARSLGVVEAETSNRVSQARAARRALETLESILVKPSGGEAVTRLERMLLSSESADYDFRQNAAVTFARSVRDRTQAHLARITVPKRQVTLTRRGGQVPVTIQNRTGFTIRLRVELDSQKLTFPAGQARPVEIEGRPHGRTLGTLTFRVEARGAGSFPITVTLQTPDAKSIVGTGDIQVRSSAVSAVTLMATAGGALFLVVAWARRAVSRRPKQAPNP